MAYSLHINDLSHPDAKAFWEYAKSLKFVTIEDEDNLSLNKEQIKAIEEARISFDKHGGKSNEEVLAKMRAKYPNAFKS